MNSKAVDMRCVCGWSGTTYVLADRRVVRACVVCGAKIVFLFGAQERVYRLATPDEVAAQSIPTQAREALRAGALAAAWVDGKFCLCDPAEVSD